MQSAPSPTHPRLAEIQTGAPASEQSSQSEGHPARSHQQGGFLYQWGPQAWIDMVMSRVMIIGRAEPLVSRTLVPILRLIADTEEIDRGYDEIRSRREKTRLLDSPRERWRKGYGNFVREAEWALLELRKHFSREEYEEIVIGTITQNAKYESQGFLEMMKGMADQKPPKGPLPEGPQKPTRWQKMVFDMFNPAGFLTGPAEVTEMDKARGSAVMYVPDCAWHTCARASSLPNPNALPEEGCLLICKGAFERLFAGEGGGLSMEFEPHLPETSCTVRMSWKVKEGAA